MCGDLSAALIYNINIHNPWSKEYPVSGVIHISLFAHVFRGDFDTINRIAGIKENKPCPIKLSSPYGIGLKYTWKPW